MRNQCPGHLPGDSMNKRFATVLIGFSLLLGCREPYFVVPITSHATISQVWTELRPAQPLRWSQQEEELGFRIDTPHHIGDGLEIVGPGGEKFVPEVELMADNGKLFVMDSHGFLGEEVVFTFKSKPADLKSIRVVRIRSSIPIKISDVLWRGYDPRNVKR
jgi:hypothetical protein